MLYNVAQLLKEGLGATRRREIAGDLFDIDENNPGPVPVRGEAKLVRTPDGILVTAHAHMVLMQACRRCLELDSAEIEIEFEEEFIPSLDIVTGLPLRKAETSDDTELLIDEHHILDLTETLRQYAVMELVGVGVCQPDCKGLCPTCGQNLNLGSCACVHETIDPRLAVLAQLLEKQSDEDRGDTGPVRKE